MQAGDRLRFVRKRWLHMSQTEMSNLFEVKQQTYSRAEKTGSFSALFRERVARCSFTKNKVVFFLNIDFLDHAVGPVFRRAGDHAGMDRVSLVQRVQQLEIQLSRMDSLSRTLQSDKMNKVIFDALASGLLPLDEKRRLVKIIQRVEIDRIKGEWD